MDALGVLTRRWQVLVVGLLLVVAAGVGVQRYVPTAYQASGQLLLLLPVEATGDAGPTNPYLNVPAGLTTTASLLASSASTEDAQAAVAADGFAAAYSVSVVPDAGPLVVVTTTGTDPADVLATRDEVMVRLDAELSQIQQDVDAPSTQFMYTAPSAVSAGAEALPGSKLRALIGVVGAGGILVLLVAFALDRLLLARRSRRAGPGPAADRSTGSGPDPQPVSEHAAEPVPVVVPVVGPVVRPVVAARSVAVPADDHPRRSVPSPGGWGHGADRPAGAEPDVVDDEVGRVQPALRDGTRRVVRP